MHGKKSICKQWRWETGQSPWASWPGGLLRSLFFIQNISLCKTGPCEAVLSLATASQLASLQVTLLHKQNMVEWICSVLCDFWNSCHGLEETNPKLDLILIGNKVPEFLKWLSSHTDSSQTLLTQFHNFQDALSSIYKCLIHAYPPPPIYSIICQYNLKEIFNPKSSFSPV